jgi:hypothetical protein
VFLYLSMPLEVKVKDVKQGETYPIIKGPNPALRSTINVFLTPASLKAAICAGESCTPAGGPLIVLQYIDRNFINRNVITRNVINRNGAR